MSEVIKCFRCGYEYDPREYNTVLPPNMHIWGVQPNEKIPQCPECDTADFMDIATRQLINDPRFKEKEKDD
jgi:Zn ribbon nucleic-acid-binding protein